MESTASPSAHGTTEDLAARLAPLLERHGLTVVLGRDATIEVRNPAAAATGPLGHALHPGLTQRIVVREDEGGLWWCWLWPGPERGGPPDVEPMVPVEDGGEAARRIAVVLYVDEPDGAET